MDAASSPHGHAAAGNGAPRSMPAPAPTATAPAWTAHMSTFPAAGGAASSGSSFPQFSASTAAILERLQGKSGHASGSAAFEAKRAEILQNYVTSDKLPTPPPIAGSGRRGRGGRVGTPSGLKMELGATPSSSTPARGRGGGRGRGRGGRGRGRGGKRKRSDSDDDDDGDDDGDDDDASDLSSSYTPLPTRTKSGRSVNKPVAFVPTLPAPAQGVKRRRSTKTLLAAKCKKCHRETEPANNRIVFCDACSTAYHQYCHVPPIANDVVLVLEKEWLCAPCTRAQQSVVHGAQHLVAAETLSIDEKRAYLATLPQPQLVSLLLTAVIRHPELPVFPPNVHDLLPSAATAVQPPQRFPPPAFHRPVTSPPNGHTPLSHNFSSHSDMDPAEAQLLGEIRSHGPPPPSPALAPRPTTTTTMDLAGNQYEEDDGYDTDPPAHYPKPGHGLARTLRPESEDLNWLVDDNFEVFSHGWKGDGTGMGADGTLDGLGDGQKVA